MKILVINSGSSSIKFQLIEIDRPASLGKGIVDRIGLKEGLFRFAPAGREAVERTADVADHRAGIRVVLDALTDHAAGIIRDPAEIDAVGHRMVLAGPSISGPVVFDEALVRLVERHTRLAPLHNPPTLAGYRAAAEVLPAVPHVGVFDTAFYAALPARSYVYAIPYEYYERHGIRRFGFHGTSHQYVSLRAALALDLFAGAAARHAAAAAIGLEGRLDALVFTAGIGENSPRMRGMIASRLGLLGVTVDREANAVHGAEALVSVQGAPVAVLVIPTNEELMIALQTRDAIVAAHRAQAHPAQQLRAQAGGAPTAS
jgi:acetate kinase